MVDNGALILSFFATPGAVGDLIKGAECIGVVFAHQLHCLWGLQGRHHAEESLALGEGPKCIVSILQLLPPCPGFLNLMNHGAKQAGSFNHASEDFCQVARGLTIKAQVVVLVVLLPGLSYETGVLAECFMMASRQCLVKRHHLLPLWTRGPLRNHLVCGLPRGQGTCWVWQVMLPLGPGQRPRCIGAEGEGTLAMDPC